MNVTFRDFVTKGMFTQSSNLVVMEMSKTCANRSPHTALKSTKSKSKWTKSNTTKLRTREFSTHPSHIRTNLRNSLTSLLEKRLRLITKFKELVGDLVMRPAGKRNTGYWLKNVKKMSLKSEVLLLSHFYDRKTKILARDWPILKWKEENCLIKLISYNRRLKIRKRSWKKHKTFTNRRLAPRNRLRKIKTRSWKNTTSLKRPKKSVLRP